MDSARIPITTRVDNYVDAFTNRPILQFELSKEITLFTAEHMILAQLLWSSRWFFIFCVLQIIVCLFISFIWTIVLSVLLFTTSRYAFVIFIHVFHSRLCSNLELTERASCTLRSPLICKIRNLHVAIMIHSIYVYISFKMYLISPVLWSRQYFHV